MLALREPAPAKVKTFPVIEIFGPTIQGEGAEAGLPTHFIRLGGCDYRCSWCDTMYAVDPATVRRDSVWLGVDDIRQALRNLNGAPRWVSISGGNPALHLLAPLVEALHNDGFLVAVETQGSVWREWLGVVDRLTVSPKGPSSDMVSPAHERQFQTFMAAAAAAEVLARSVLKIVCFDETDLVWATRLAADYPSVPLMLSAGTPVPATGPVREAVGDRYRWLCERVAGDPDLGHARVLPQLHVIAWKEARGV
jgi:7-carboxy-7-deazaguanine synthase